MDSNDAVRFWTLPDGSLPEDANPPVTDAQLAFFRQQYDFQLPDALVVLYRQQNGGFSIRFESLFWPIAQGASDDVTTLHTLCETFHQDEDLERQWAILLGDLGNVLVFLGEGHFYFVLNYNQQKNGEPTVCYVDENGVRETTQTFEEWIAEALGNG